MYIQKKKTNSKFWSVCNCVSRKSLFAHSKKPVLPHLLMKSYISQLEAWEVIHHIFKQMTTLCYPLTSLHCYFYPQHSDHAQYLSKCPNGLLTLRVLLILPLDRKQRRHDKTFQVNSSFHKQSRGTTNEKCYAQASAR